jgi:hypothetical protein
VFTLTWSVMCPQDLETTASNCTRTETLVFDDAPRAEPLRIPSDTFAGQWCTIRYASRDREGSGILLQAQDVSPLVKRDLTGALVWENDWRARSVLGTYTPLEASLSPSDTLVTGLQLAPEPEMPLPYPSDLVLLELDREGAALSFVTLAEGLSFGTPYAHPMHDPQGRLILFMIHEPDPIPGDLIVVRHDPEGEESAAARIQREDYLTLEPLASAADSESNIYLATLAGGRQLEEQQPLLCRVTSDFEDVRCFAIDAVPRAMYAGGPGEVYTLSEAGLQRYDLPL